MLMSSSKAVKSQPLLSHVCVYLFVGRISVALYDRDIFLNNSSSMCFLSRSRRWSRFESAKGTKGLKEAHPKVEGDTVEDQHISYVRR